MVQDRFAIGLRKLREIDGSLGLEFKESLDKISSDLSKMVIKLFGDVYTREGLSLRERELIAISTLLAMGDCEGQLRMHTSAALRAGATKKEIIEILLQDINYCGIPRVLNASKIILEVFGTF